MDISNPPDGTVLRLPLVMRAQPDDRSCGPTCLQAVYRYFGHHEPLEELIETIPQLETGGTLAVQLGCHALKRGFRATIYTYNLQLFDPTWFPASRNLLRDRLRQQAEHKPDDGRLGTASEKYLEYLELGGSVKHELLNSRLLRRFLAEGVPVLTGLSSTYLYSASREVPEEDRPDDIRGEPVGHFVVLCGFDPGARTLTIADPWPEAAHPDQIRVHPTSKVIAAILLGVLTYDANLLVIRPR